MINWSFSIKSCSNKFSVHILRLLAGKFGPFYTEFSPATFRQKNIKGFRFLLQKNTKITSCKKNRRRKLNFPLNKNFFARDNALTTKYQKAVRKDLTFRWKFSRSHIPYLSSHFNDFFANLTSISLSLKLFMLLFTEQWQFILPALACNTGHTKLKAHRRF